MQKFRQTWNTCGIWKTQQISYKKWIFRGLLNLSHSFHCCSLACIHSSWSAAVESQQYLFIILPKPSTTLHHVLSNQCSMFSRNSFQMIAASLLSDHCSMSSWFRHKYLGCCYQTHVRSFLLSSPNHGFGCSIVTKSVQGVLIHVFRSKRSGKLIFHTISGSLIHTCIRIKHTHKTTTIWRIMWRKN